MEIQVTQKEQVKKINEKIKDISKILKQIKISLIDLARQQTLQRKQLYNQRIDESVTNLNDKLTRTQIKLLKGYIKYHLESQKLLIPNQDQFLTSFVSTFDEYFKSDNCKQNKNNMLFESFKKWFFYNNYSSRTNHTNQRYLTLTKDIERLLTHIIDQLNFNNENNSINTNQHVNQIKIILITIIQINLSISLLKISNYSYTERLLHNIKRSYNHLIQIQRSKDKQIQTNNILIEQLTNKHEINIKNNHLQKNPNQLTRRRSIINSYQSNDSSFFKAKMDQSLNNQQEKIFINQFHQIKDKLQKQNQQLFIQSKRLKVKLDTFYNQIRLIQTIIHIKSGKVQNLSVQFKTKIFQKEVLNKIIDKTLYYGQKYTNQMQKNQSFRRISDQILLNGLPQSKLSQSFIKKQIFQMTIKQYFNFCLLLKKSNFIKEAIIYFQILTFHYKRKQLINVYCLQKFNGQNQFDFKRSFKPQLAYQRKQKAINSLSRFINNQQVLKILIYSLINLIQLYERKDRFQWSILTLKYLKNIIQTNVIKNLVQIKRQLEKSQSQLNDITNIQQKDQYKTQISRTCRLIQSYEQFISQLNYSLLTNSLKSKTNQLQSKTNLFYSKTNLFNSKTTICTKQSFLSFRSVRMKKLHQKQNQLKRILNQPIKNFQSCTLTPNFMKRQSNQNNFKLNIELKHFIKKGMISDRGDAYKITSRAFQKRKIQNNINRKTLQKSKYLTTIQNSHLEIQGSNAQFLQSLNNSKISLNSKPSLKKGLSLKGMVSNISTQNSTTYVAIKNGNTHLLKKQKSLAFLNTSKSIKYQTKQQKQLIKLQKLLSNPQYLQCYLSQKLSHLQKIINPQMQSNYSITQAYPQQQSLMKQIFNLQQQVNTLLATLNTHNSPINYQQKLILIGFKINFVQIVAHKLQLNKNAHMYQQLLSEVNHLHQNHQHNLHQNHQHNLHQNHQHKLNIKKHILWNLAQIYFQMLDSNRTIECYLQLTKMNQPVGFLKVGEVYMKLKDYPNSIKYLQRYANSKQYNMESKVRLAHAYSKIPQYYTKTVDILSGILLSSNSNLKFRAQIISRVYPDNLIQSCVILLSSLFKRSENLQKSIDLCINYNKINIKNFRVMHVLGGYYREKMDTNNSFICYLNALQNNPQHSPSFIQLTEFITGEVQYKTQAVQLLRKCYRVQIRNTAILRALVAFLHHSNQLQQFKTGSDLTYIILIKFAEIFKTSQIRGYSIENFYQEAIITYQWALSLLSKNINVSNIQQLQLIYKSLAQICLKKGDYSKSEIFYKDYQNEMQRYINHCCLNDQLRTQKIQKTKIQSFFLLGKVKKHQKAYGIAIQYFDNSYQLYKKYEQELKNSQKYLHLFQAGHCYFLMQQPQQALNKFNQHKQYLLNFIYYFDKQFFIKQKTNSMRILTSYELVQKKPNYLKQLIQKQKETNQYHIDVTQTQRLLKKNYIQTQIFIAFSFTNLQLYDHAQKIYHRVMQFIRQVQKEIHEKDNYKENNKKYLEKDENQRIKKLLNKVYPLQQDLAEWSKVCLLNLANLQKIHCLFDKCIGYMEQCVQRFPQNLQIQRQLYKLYEQKGTKGQESNNYFSQVNLNYKSKLFISNCSISQKQNSQQSQIDSKCTLSHIK